MVRHTQRLSLRMPDERDLGFVTALFARPELVAHRPDPTPDSPEESARRLARDRAHWRLHGFGRWAVEAEGRPIGFGGVTVSTEFDGLNMSYHLHPDCWGGRLRDGAGERGFGIFIRRLACQAGDRPRSPHQYGVAARAGKMRVQLCAGSDAAWRADASILLPDDPREQRHSRIDRPRGLDAVTISYPGTPPPYCAQRPSRRDRACHPCARTVHPCSSSSCRYRSR